MHPAVRLSETELRMLAQAQCFNSLVLCLGVSARMDVGARDLSISIRCGDGHHGTGTCWHHRL
jgi:hypothetical protein